MRRVRELLNRPLREQPRWALAGLAGLLVTAVLAVALTGGGGPQPDPPGARRPANPAPGPVLNPAPSGGGGPARPASVSPDDLARARRVARAFLGTYLPVLYGHARPADITAVTPPVRRALLGAQRVPAAIRRRQPRLTGVAATPQTPTSVLMTATVDDRVVAPFRLIFTVERQRDGRWLVADLAND